MMKHLKIIVIALAVVIAGTAVAIPVLASAAGNDTAQQTEALQDSTASDETADAVIISGSEAQEKSSKAMSSAIVVALAAAVGAFSMGLAICKSVESIARQPEAAGKIQTMLMLGLVFIETAIIYALIVAILIIFVL